MPNVTADGKWVLEEDVVAFKDHICDEIVRGLNRSQKELPAKLFYDEKGSQLFDQITELDAYYPTRTETKIMKEFIGEIIEEIGPHSLLIEYGSGSSVKTKTLLDNLQDMAGYVTIDISGEHLIKTAEQLKIEYPDLLITPVCADYTKPFDLPEIERDVCQKVAYFPGSTIGNFYPDEAVEFVDRIGKMVGPGGGFLIGVDLQKETAVLNLAYNDPEKVTAAFNLNSLVHLNREYDGDFILNCFKHHAFYNQDKGRIEMHLVSLEDQAVNVCGEKFEFFEGETIRTEVSYKYTVESFSELAERSGFEVRKVWVDSNKMFSVQYLIRK